MFNNQKKLHDRPRIDTIIGPSSNIEGKISATGTVRIDGKYTGDIFTDEDVLIGENGVLNGNINARNVSISGKVDGNVFCKGLLEIFPSGHLDGDIEVSKISISDGAIYKGNCNMILEKILEI
jgi:cytoskeletal protein CcmA (bactofilin family)